MAKEIESIIHIDVFIVATKRVMFVNYRQSRVILFLFFLFFRTKCSFINCFLSQAKNIQSLQVIRMYFTFYASTYLYDISQSYF